VVCPIHGTERLTFATIVNDVKKKDQIRIIHR